MDLNERSILLDNVKQLCGGLSDVMISNCTNCIEEMVQYLSGVGDNPQNETHRNFDDWEVMKGLLIKLQSSMETADIQFIGSNLLAIKNHARVAERKNEIKKIYEAFYIYMRQMKVINSKISILEDDCTRVIDNTQDSNMLDEHGNNASVIMDEIEEIKNQLITHNDIITVLNEMELIYKY